MFSPSCTGCPASLSSYGVYNSVQTETWPSQASSHAHSLQWVVAVYGHQSKQSESKIMRVKNK